MAVLIVTALYKFTSKFSFETYIEYFKKLLFNTRCNFVLFTTTDLVDILPKHERLTIITLDPSKWTSYELLTEAEFPRYVHGYASIFMEGKLPDPRLLRLYSEKYSFVNRAIERFPQYNYYFWLDAGCIRNDEWIPYLKTFPSETKIKSLNIDDKICFQNRIYVESFRKQGPCNIGIVGGALIFGNKTAWGKFRNLFLLAFAEMRKLDMLVVQDEIIYSTMLCRFPEHVTGLETYHPTIIPEIAYRYTADWFGGIALLSDKYTHKLNLCIREIPKITYASWGIREIRMDVTDIINILKHNCPIKIERTMFQDKIYGDKFLLIQYENGVQQRVDENTMFYLCS
jgi:hypothetical protein